ncbi:MAG: hypothetical protein HYZ36_08435 [Pedosphaera parvula]|nr:hypothetical protein [Pedosphaera parvula]
MNMKPHGHGKSLSTPAAGAFTLPEVMISVGLVAIMFVSLYGGVSAGIAVVSVARENLRATQILTEKMETMRLYNWSQITSNGFVPTTFTTQLFPTTAATTLASTTSGSTSSSLTSSGSGVTYYGTVAMSVPDISASYSNTMRLVIISLTWTNGNVARAREMQTYVSANGLQQYIY